MTVWAMQLEPAHEMAQCEVAYSPALQHSAP